MLKPERRKLERVQYWQGQMLRSRDFHDIEAGEAQRRWWHNRALHNAYGVAEGLTCSLVPAGTPTGVSISPGVAYDIFGRELILEKARIIPLPANISPNLVGAVSLLMRYKPPSRRLRPDETAELCWTAPGSAAAGTAEFVWRVGDNLNPAQGVAVFAVYYSVGTFKGPDPYYVGVFARPDSRPLLASGFTIPGSTAWTPWSAGFTTDANDNQIPDLIGVQTWIDTSAAGFTETPCYFAFLQGSLWNSQTQQLTPAIFQSIADESLSGFTFRLWLQILPLLGGGTFGLRARASMAARSFAFVSDPSDFALFAQQQELYVSWVGCLMRAPISCCSKQQASSVTGS
jgi:hypothetical protein